MKLTKKEEKEAKLKVKNLKKIQNEQEILDDVKNLKVVFISLTLVFIGIMLRYFIKNIYLDAILIISSIGLIIYGTEYIFKQQIKDDFFADMINQISEKNKYTKMKLSFWKVAGYKSFSLLISITIFGILFGIAYLIKLLLLFIIKNMLYVILVLIGCAIIFFVIKAIINSNKKIGENIISKNLKDKEVSKYIKRSKK